MKENKKGKKLTPEQLKKIEEDNALRLSLIWGPESFIVDKGSDKVLDRENERINLMGGGSTSIKDHRDFVLKSAQPYSPMYPAIYFKEICRMFGRSEAEAAQYFKRREVAMFTREIVYGRFDAGVLLSMHVLNPYRGDYIKREFKHFQFLTPAGLERLSVIIGEVIEIAKTCTTYREFRSKYIAQYKLAFQLSLYDED